MRLQILCFTLLCTYFSIAIADNWSQPVTISNSLNPSRNPIVVINPSGNGVAIWENRGSFTVIDASFYDGTSWTTPESISSDGASASSASVAFNDSGEAVAIWKRNDIIQVSIYNGTVWTTPQNLSDVSHAASSPHITLNNSGTAIAIWKQNNGSYDIIQTSIYDGSTWSTAQSLSSNGVNAGNPQVELNNKNQAVAIWERDVIQASIYNNGNWSAPSDLSAIGLSVHSPKVSVNDALEAIVLWEDHASIWIIQGSIYNGTSWSSSAFNLTTPSSQGEAGPQISLNNSDRALSIWKQTVSGSTYAAQSSAYINGVWEPIVTLSSYDADFDHPEIGFNNYNDGIATWQTKNGSPYTVIQTALYNGSIWTSPITLSDLSANARDASVSLNDLDQALVVWSLDDSGLEVIQYVVNNDILPATPPSNLSGTRKKDRFPFETDYFNSLSWSQTSSPQVSSYNVYRGSYLIGNIIATLPLVFNDHTINKNETYTYSVTAVKTNTTESAPITTTIYP